ncbi:hypothetical protein GF336_07325 [Candidatus Woesearchaeota archaeon]|nr:hypothetical protein [Candidatus Woesearchaeota archaeon]
MNTAEEKNQNVRRYNQHFIIDNSVLDDLILYSGIESDETVLEIGPGNGSITEKLVEDAEKVIAIESDIGLQQYLERLKVKYDNLDIIYGNALNVRFPKFDRIVSNISFNITEPLLNKLFDENFKSGTVVFGARYTEEATKEHPSTRMGILTRSYFEVECIKEIPSYCFEPEPSTDASIVTINPIKKTELLSSFRKYIIRCIWDQKTRPLEHALSTAFDQYQSSKGNKNSDSYKFMNEIAKKYNHDLNIRTDRMSNPEFLDLYELLGTIKLKKFFSGHKPKGGAKNWRIEYQEYL